VVKLPTPTSLVVTTDTLVEGTHFKSNLFRGFLTKNEQWKSLGHKIMAINLSDFAAMGNVEPFSALVTLGLGGDISVDTVDNLYSGMGKFCKNFNISVIGGDIIRSDKSIISLTLLGRASGTGKLIPRDKAKIGDILMLTGPLGLSSAGLKILIAQAKSKHPSVSTLLHSHLYPQPKIREGALLSGKEISATSLIDTSDDLMTSLEIISEKSGVGFELNLDKFPIHSALKKISKKFNLSPLSFVLYGGEDYQLAFTVPSSKVNSVKKKIPSAYVAGRVKPKSYGIQLKMNHRPFRIKDTRFRHFSS